MCEGVQAAVAVTAGATQTALDQVRVRGSASVVRGVVWGGMMLRCGGHLREGAHVAASVTAGATQTAIDQVRVQDRVSVVRGVVWGSMIC